MLRVALLVLAAAAPPGRASSFTIAPIRVQLAAADRSAALMLTNAAAEPVVIGVRAMVWTQPDGQERLAATRDVLANPAVLHIPGKGSRLVRVVLRRAPDAVRELSYRVVLDELPPAIPAGVSGLQVAMRITVPVFVAPRQGPAVPDVRWELHRLRADEYEIVGLNRGTAHVQVTDLAVQVDDSTPLHATTAHYLLPGDRVTWRLKPESAVPTDRAISIRGRSDQGDFSAAIAVWGTADGAAD